MTTDFNRILSPDVPNTMLGPTRIVKRLAWPAALALCSVFMFGASEQTGNPPQRKAATPVGSRAAVPQKNPQQTSFDRIMYYVPSRVADFIDMWRLDVGFGLGLGINLRPTKGLQVGLAAYDSTRIGLRGRRTPVWHEWSLEGGFDGMYQELGETERGFHEFGGTIHVVLVGLEAALDIEEAIDFVLGLFGGDPADDDFR
ncbi:hypothetical protein FJY63_02755 [Candidatus Sumerlaeota bacterium]|nr:hypothetical protein [Candidatus Sumerlaeota bacterium]